jgi:hypothetical protein
MNLLQMKTWFAEKSPAQKKFTALMIAHKLTIVLRDIVSSTDTKEALAAAILISELDHRLLSYVTASMTRQPTFPDDFIVEIIDTALTDKALSGAANQVWEDVTTKVDDLVASKLQKQ